MTIAIGTVTKLAGGDADAITRELVYGERVICLVELTLTEVGLKPGNGGAMEHRSLKPVGVYELEGELGVRTLNALKERARAAAQAGAGAIPGIAEHFDDAAERAGQELVEKDGVILTPEELAAIDGDGNTGDTIARNVGSDLDETQVPPFDGYDPATIPVIKEWLDERTGAERTTRARWVLTYETAHKARKSLLDYCYGITEPLGDAPPLEDAEPGFGPGDDVVDLGEEPDLPDSPDEPTAETPADDLELEVDDDFEL